MKALALLSSALDTLVQEENVMIAHRLLKMKGKLYIISRSKQTAKEFPGQLWAASHHLGLEQIHISFQ